MTVLAVICAVLVCAFACACSFVAGMVWLALALARAELSTDPDPAGVSAPLRSIPTPGSGFIRGSSRGPASERES